MLNSQTAPEMRDYLRLLDSSLPHVFQHEPEIVFYLAGADPYAVTSSAGWR